MTETQGGDRRVRRTKKLLRQGLIALLMEKELDEITVKELVERVDVNRGTFYLHAHDIRDLFRQVEEETAAGLLTQIEALSPRTLQSCLTAIFRFLDANRDLSVLLLLKNGDQLFVEQLKRLLEDRYFEVIRQAYHGQDTLHYRLFSAYAVSGCVGLLQRWLSEEIDLNAEQMADLAGELVRNGLNYFA